jgi:hypothetical protein
MPSGGKRVVGALGVVDEGREVADVVLVAREVDEGVVGLEKERDGLNGMMIESFGGENERIRVSGMTRVSFGRALVVVCAAIFVTCGKWKW